MSKYHLELDASQLTAFQHCEKHYEYSYVKHLEPKKRFHYFEKGTNIAKMLELFYAARLRGYDQRRVNKLVRFLSERILEHKLLDADDALLLSTRFLSYCKYYREERFKVIAVEKPFRKVLYESPNVLFTYTGRPDLIVVQGGELMSLDHKTQSREGQIADLSNQHIGYSWAIGSNYFMYNYFGLQTTKDEAKWFKRELLEVSDTLKARWREETIKWYFRIAAARTNKEFDRSYNCDTKYGVCKYIKACAQGTQRAEDFVLIDSFQKRKKEWSPF